MSFNPFIGTSNSSGSGGTGQDGRGIQEIFWILSSTGTKPGEAGAKDTYQILYTDGSTSTFIVQNGNNGRDGAKGESGTNGKDGQNGKDGITPIFRVSSNYIQVSIDNGLNYTNLVSLDSLSGADGESLEFNWLGTKLGIKKAGESEYTYVELKGETGDKGERGENGAEGKSAYQSALDTGFDGTETQWVESLKGEQGLQGVSITAASINNDGHLILTLSSGSTIDAGNAKGADGTSINIKGSLNNSSELPSTGQKIGDCYLINGHLWVYTNSLKETAINGFDDAGNIQGPAGSGSSVRKGTILDTTTSTSQQDTLNNWGNKCYIKDGDLDWMTLNDIVTHWGGVASQNNFIGGESEKYGIYMANWSEQEKNTSILFIEPIDVIAGDFLLTFNCNISSWMNQTLNIHFLTATGNTRNDILTQLTEKIAAQDYVKTITLAYAGSSSQKDVTAIDTLPVVGDYYMYIEGFKKADNSNFNLIKIDYINF